MASANAHADMYRAPVLSQTIPPLSVHVAVTSLAQTQSTPLNTSKSAHCGLSGSEDKQEVQKATIAHLRSKKFRKVSWYCLDMV